LIRGYKETIALRVFKVRVNKGDLIAWRNGLTRTVNFLADESVEAVVGRRRRSKKRADFIG